MVGSDICDSERYAELWMGTHCSKLNFISTILFLSIYLCIFLSIYNILVCLYIYNISTSVNVISLCMINITNLTI